MAPAGPRGVRDLAEDTRDEEEAGGRHDSGLRNPQQPPPSQGIHKMAAGAPKWRRGPGGEDAGAVPGLLRRAQ